MRNTKPKIWIHGRLPDLERHRPKLQQIADIEHTKTSKLSQSELIDSLKDSDAAITLLSDQVDEGALRECAKLKVISNYAVGYNNIETPYAKERGIWVTHTPDVLTNATAELALTLLLCTARRAHEGESLIRKQQFEGWEPDLLLGQELLNKKLGILGFGRIGQRFAELAQGLGMKIQTLARKNKPAPKLDSQEVTTLAFDELIRTSDVLSLHVPLKKDTQYLIGEAEFKKMKAECILINTSRGPVVDEKALCKALGQEEIWGAGLDVFEREPDVEADLLKTSRCTLLPHLGSATWEARSQMTELVVESVVAALEGKRPPHLVPEMRL
jgi:glyoxylate reductase